jgi:hypothetical protein
MPKYIIEREVPGAENLSEEELRNISRKSSAVLKEMGVPYHWVQTYVAGDKLYCIHIAPDEETIREHGRRGGFPINNIAEVKAIIDSTTGE